MKNVIGIFIVTLLILTAFTTVGITNNQIIEDIRELDTSSALLTYVKETYMVPMRDGVKLATDVYLPYEDYPPHGCILIRLPYNKDNVEQFLNGQDYDLEEWINDGWPFVIQDERGSFDSEGVISFDNDYYDGYDTVEWVASQNWSNGKIATWGRSAFGMNQYIMAGTNPPNLECQYVGVATPDWYKHWASQGGELRKSLMEGSTGELGELFIEGLKNENFSLAFWGKLYLDDKYQNVNVPAIHIGGWYDIYAQGAIDAFMGYQYKGGDGAIGKQKLIMGPWAHTQFGYNRSKTGQLEFPENQFDTFSRNMFRDMINQYTMDTGDEFDKWSTISYYMMGDVDYPDAPGNKWMYADEWPVESIETPYYFHEENLLSIDEPSSYDSITYLYNPERPVITKGGQNLHVYQGPMDQRGVESRQDVILFTSDVLTKSVGVTGQIKARLFVSSDCIDTDFTVKLCDVYPDGRSMLITDGILRMRNRNGCDHWEFMNPGEIYEIEIDLWSTAYIWNTSHQIRVAVSSSNSPRFLANPNTGDSIYQFYLNPTFKIANNTLFLDNEHPSCIIFPIVEVKAGKSLDYKLRNSLFIDFFKQHPSLFPLLQEILDI